MSTPNEPQDPYASGAKPEQPAQPGGAAPQYPTAPPYGTPPAPTGYPAAPQYGAAPYPPAPQYGAAPGYGGGYVYPKNSLAVWSLVLGIVSVVLCGFLTAIPAIIVGNNAKRAVAAGEADNGGLATAGIVIGWIMIALTVVGAVIITIAIVSSGGWTDFVHSYSTTSTT